MTDRFCSNSPRFGIQIVPLSTLSLSMCLILRGILEHSLQVNQSLPSINIGGMSAIQSSRTKWNRSYMSRSLFGTWIMDHIQNQDHCIITWAKILFTLHKETSDFIILKEISKTTRFMHLQGSKLRASPGMEFSSILREWAKKALKRPNKNQDKNSKIGKLN